MVRRVGASRHLIGAAYAPATLAKYHAAVRQFLDWCAANDEKCSTGPEMDELLTDFFHDLYDSGGSRVTANCCLNGVLLHLLHYKTQLPMARLTLRGWSRKHPPKPYPPLTWELTVAIAARLSGTGRPRHAIGVLVAFDCYLRIGELLGLHREDIAMPNDPRLNALKNPPIGALRLRKTKTGLNQFVVLKDADVAALLQQVVAATPPKGRLFPFTPNDFRKAFKSACRHLGLSSLYVPHSLRHGAATRDHMGGTRVEDILERGRWASTKSARRYIQSGQALLLATQVPPRIAELGRLVATDLLGGFSLPQSH
jgi:integrase